MSPPEYSRCGLRIQPACIEWLNDKLSAFVRSCSPCQPKALFNFLLQQAIHSGLAQVDFLLMARYVNNRSGHLPYGCGTAATTNRMWEQIVACSRSETRVTLMKNMCTAYPMHGISGFNG